MTHLLFRTFSKVETISISIVQLRKQRYRELTWKQRRQRQRGFRKTSRKRWCMSGDLKDMHKRQVNAGSGEREGRQLRCQPVSRSGGERWQGTSSKQWVRSWLECQLLENYLKTKTRVLSSGVLEWNNLRIEWKGMKWWLRGKIVSDGILLKKRKPMW
jgi:hypothetical protein